MTKNLLPSKNWRKVFLKDNPFAIVPKRLKEAIEWADMVDCKSKIENRMIESMQTSPSCIILNWGEWGGGKTHAGIYFSQENILKDLAKKANTDSAISFIMAFPRDSKDIVRAIYLDVLGKFGFQKFWHFTQKFYKSVKTNSLKVLSQLSGNQEFAEAFIKLAKTREGEKEYELLKAYFNLAILKAELRKLNLVRSIDSISDMINVLTTFFNIIVYKETGDITSNSELFLWIDELEDILSLPSKEQITLRNFLRDLIDYVPRDLTLFLNISLKTGVKFEDIPAYLGDAVMSRIRIHNRFYFSQLPEEDSLQYVKELLKLYRVKPIKDDFYPFDEKSLKILLSKLPLRNPRKINEECTFLIESAIADTHWKPGHSFITFETIKKQLPDLFEKKK